MLSEQEAKQIKSIPEWQALESHLKEAITVLDSVMDIEESEDHDKVARGKKYAIKCIEAILAPFDIEENEEEDNQQEAREKLGLSNN